jgi:hypothetical protein
MKGQTLMPGILSVPRIVGMALLFAWSGCSLEQEFSRTPRTAVEQALLTHAVERALTNLTVQLPQDANVKLEATGLESDRSRLRMTSSDLGTVSHAFRDISYIRDAVAAELGRRGYRIRTRDVDDSPYLIRVMAESFGTMQGMTFFGMPPVQSVLIPFALPELTLYKQQNQSGYARLHVDVYDNHTGEFLGSSATLVGRTFYNQYTVLFFLTWNRTDLIAPP